MAFHQNHAAGRPTWSENQLDEAGCHAELSLCHVLVEVPEGLPHPGEVGKCDVVARLCPLEVGRGAWLHHPSHTPWELPAASDLNHRHPVPYTIVLMSLISAISKHSWAAIMPFLSNLP